MSTMTIENLRVRVWEIRLDGEIMCVCHLPTDGPIGCLDEIAKRYNFFEKHDIAEVERKLEVLEEIRRFIDSTNKEPHIPLYKDLWDRAVDIVCLVKPTPTTVGDLKPGAGDRVRILDDEAVMNEIFIRPRSCEDIDKGIKPDEVVMMYEKDNSLCLVDKLTPCEIVKS